MLELKPRLHNLLHLLLLLHQSTMSILPWHPLINHHHQLASSLHCWILNHPYPTSAHRGPQLWMKRKTVQRSFRIQPLQNWSSINGNVLAMKLVCFFLLVLNNSQLFPSVTDDSHNNEGMHCDVHVMDIEDSESESQGAQRPNKKNPTANVDEFSEKIAHQGDKKGHQRCKSCAYVFPLSSISFFYINPLHIHK